MKRKEMKRKDDDGKRASNGITLRNNEIAKKKNEKKPRMKSKPLPS